MESLLIVGFILFTIYLWKHRDESGKIRIPNWTWKVLAGLGIFLGFVLLRNARSVIGLLTTQADSWWPVVEMYATKLLNGFRSLLEKMGRG